MKKELFMLPPFISVILKKENQILLVKRKKAKYYSGYFVFPGGKVDQGETVFSAAKRELEEELGISLDVQSSRIIHVCHFKRENGFEGLDFYVLATEWRGEIKNLEPEKHEEIKWFEINNLPENIADNHKNGLDQINKNIFYSEMGWE